MRCTQSSSSARKTADLQQSVATLQSTVDIRSSANGDVLDVQAFLLIVVTLAAASQLKTKPPRPSVALDGNGLRAPDE